MPNNYHNKIQFNGIIENKFIETLVQKFKRSPIQQNALQESDAELIRIPGTTITIALTIDSVVEEIERGLYTDPYLIGWMTVVSNVSDLAAVGAEPIGILLNETLPPALGMDYLNRLQQGIHDACSESKIYVLGGDTNFSSNIQMSACAIGYLPDGDPVKRIGCKPGDHLFSSGKLGQGSSYAYLKFSGGSSMNIGHSHYKPKPRLQEGQIIRKYASSCMDTSDGFIPAIDQLMRLNHVGFNVDTSLMQFIHPEAIDLSQKAQIPLWMMLAGPHGEFELIFTIPDTSVDAFLKSASVLNWEPCALGKVIEDKELKLLQKDKFITLETGKIRNLFNEVNGNMDKYIKGLFSFNY